MSYTPVSQLNDLYPTDCPHLLAVRAEYATWNWFTQNGYILYSRGDIKSPYEHQLVAEHAYGPVHQGYHVHHVDGDIKRNAAVNLRVVSASDHAMGHNFTLLMVCFCPTCSKRFELALGRARKRSRQFYCSDVCAHIGNRKVDRPSRERLAELIETVGNWCELGRMFGVRDNAVRKWARIYGLL